MGLFITLSAFDEEEKETFDFDVNELYDYQKAYESQEVGVCSISSVKTYEDYRLITSPSSKQFWYIREHMTVDESGFLYDEDGFIGAALGSYYGEIGDRYYFTLDTGIIIPIVKIDEKADKDTDENNCFHPSDGSVIEFVISTDYAAEYFGRWGNGLILSGNYNNIDLFKGNIAKVEKASDTRKENYVTFKENESEEYNNIDIFYYASGY